LTGRPPMWSISANFLNTGQPDPNPAEFHLKMRVSVQHPGASADKIEKKITMCNVET
jgi:hypothetical protein